MDNNLKANFSVCIPWLAQKPSRNIRKRTFGHVRPAKIQISLNILTVCSESSVDVFLDSEGNKVSYADNEDLDQTARMRRLI